ncbi:MULTISPECIES: 50S ribosomal protein L25 [Cysteiniphilum]|nr:MULTISPECIES: 50S ribosomal protein L25 [Cysteiniphilum]
MTEFTLHAELKTETGTGVSRRLRKAGKVPAIIYGNGSEATSITLDHNKILHATENKAFYTATVTIDINGKTESVKIKALQRHPYKPKILHADFVRA